jgi:hypothetical protein
MEATHPLQVGPCQCDPMLDLGRGSVAGERRDRSSAFCRARVRRPTCAAVFCCWAMHQICPATGRSGCSSGNDATAVGHPVGAADAIVTRPAPHAPARPRCGPLRGRSAAGTTPVATTIVSSGSAASAGIVRSPKQLGLLTGRRPGSFAPAFGRGNSFPSCTRGFDSRHQLHRHRLHVSLNRRSAPPPARRSRKPSRPCWPTGWTA